MKSFFVTIWRGIVEVIEWFYAEPERVFVAFLLVAMVSCVGGSCYVTISINSQPTTGGTR